MTIIAAHPGNRDPSPPDWQRWILGADERLVRIAVYHSEMCIRGLRLITTRRESPWFGESYGTLSELKAPENFCISGIYSTRAAGQVPVSIGVRLESIKSLEGHPSDVSRDDVLTRNALTCPCIKRSEVLESDSEANYFAYAHPQLRAIAFAAESPQQVQIITASEYTRMTRANQSHGAAGVSSEWIHVLTEDEVITGVEIASRYDETYKLSCITAIRLVTTRGSSPWLGKYYCFKTTVKMFTKENGKKSRLTDLAPLYHNDPGLDEQFNVVSADETT